MSHNILIPFYHVFIEVTDNAKSKLVKLIECLLNNNLSILLIIDWHIYSFIILVSCSSEELFIDANLGCVCGVGYYQTTSATTKDPPVCQACPAGSTTEGNTNSQDISACGNKF